MKEDKKYLTSPDFDLLGERLLTMPDFDNCEYEIAEEVKSKVYHCSNERLNAYFKDLNIKGSRIATVGSSGDQVLNAIFYGAKDITLIDANIFTRAYFEYKTAMIKNLDFETFKSHLGMFSMFNWKTYSKISHDLSKRSKQFFDELMLNQDENGHDYDEGYLTDSMIRNNLFHTPCYPHDEKVENLFYNNAKDFKKLKHLLIKNNFKINYINADITEFSKKLNGKFDYIFLSNIYDYVDEKIMVPIINKLYRKLNAGGAIQYYYTFDNYEINKNNLISKTAKRKFLNIGESEFGHFVYFIEKPLKQKNAEFNI